MEYISCYSVNVGNYDPPRKDNIKVFTEYNRFTNNPRNSRIYFILPHKFLNCRISVLISGELHLKVKPEVLVKEWLGDYDIALFKHPWRDCVHEEIVAALKVVKLKDELEILKAQGEYYKKIKFPQHIGTLPETAIIIRRHTNLVRDFNNAWWAEMCRWSYRDQVSFPVVLRDFPKLKVNFITPDVRVHPYTSLGFHKG